MISAWAYSRKGVIGALAFVDMVVRVHYRFVSQLATQDLNGSVGNDLIGVHVALRATASLPDHQREVIQELALPHFCGSLYNGVPHLLVKHTKSHIDLRKSDHL